MSKKIAITFVFIAIMGIVYCIFFSVPPTVDQMDIQKVYLETISEAGAPVRISVAKQEDINNIKKALSGEPYRESGTEFAEGGYRIVLVGSDRELRIYPYGGDLELMRIGDKGDKYCDLQKDTVEYTNLETTLNKYLNIKDYQGVYEWNQ